MRTLLRIVVCGLVLAGPAVVRLLAADPTAPAETGRVLVLENERALEGDIHREGDQYCIRRNLGEVWLPGDKVLRLCASWEEAFAFVSTQANLRDPDERLRLARWCLAYGLREHALAETTAAVQMRPGHAPSRQLLTILQRPAATPPTPPPAQPQAVAKVPTPPALAIDLSVDSVGLFATRVQPVLMNTCASCHASGKETAFALSRAGGTNMASRRAVQQNLAAVLAHIDPEHPHASPLLMRAVTDHGKTGQAPLKAQSPPYRILKEWIELTLASNPFLREQHGPARAAAFDGARSSEPITRAAPVVSQPMGVAAQPVAPGRAAPAEPAVAPADEFDPAPFNQQLRGPGQ